MLLDALAPWIIDSWLEVLAGMSFELPVIPLDTYQFHVALTVSGLLLLMLGWRMVGPLPARARVAALSLLTLALLSPLAILTGHHLDELSRLPEFAGRFRKSLDAPPAPATAGPSIPVSASTAPTQIAPPQSESAALREASQTAAAPVAPPAPLIQETASLPPPGAMPPAGVRPSPTDAANSAARKVVRRLANLLPGDTKPGLMPVFYGTDRAASANTGHSSYTAERGQRLEIGHAFIQIPRDRQGKPASQPWTAGQAEIESLGGLQAKTEGAANQFAISSLKPLSRDDFLQQAVLRLSASQHDKDHALIFVPGYNTSFEAALYRAAQIAYDLRFDGAPFVYSWPSDGASANYKHDTESVTKATTYFAEFVRIVATSTGAKTLSFVAHGLGSRLPLDALAALKDKLPPGVTIRELILTTPDIDASAFKDRINNASGLANRTTLYVASTDRALNISRRYTGGIPRAGDMLAGGPLVIPGVDTVDISISGTEAIGLNHPAYVQDAAVIRHMASRLRDGTGLQSAALESIATPAGPYLRLH